MCLSELAFPCGCYFIHVYMHSCVCVCLRLRTITAPLSWDHVSDSPWVEWTQVWYTPGWYWGSTTWVQKTEN